MGVCGTIGLMNILLKEGYKMIQYAHVYSWKDLEMSLLYFHIVDDINIIGTPEELDKTINCVKKEFEMKDFGRTKFCLGLQIEYLKNGNFIYQQTYVRKVL